MCTGNTDTCYQPNVDYYSLTASAENFFFSDLCYGNNVNQTIEVDNFLQSLACYNAVEETTLQDISVVEELYETYLSELSSPQSSLSSPISSPMSPVYPPSPIQYNTIDNLVRTEKAGPQDWIVHTNCGETTYKDSALYHDVQWVSELSSQLYRENHPDPQRVEFYKGSQGCIYLLRGHVNDKHKPPVLPNGKWKCHTLKADRIEPNSKGWRYNIPKTTLCCKVLQWMVNWNGEQQAVTMYHYYHT